MPKPANLFPRVAEAREILRERAIEILEAYLAVAAQAKAAGKDDVALDAYKWLIEHMPRTDDKGIIDSSAAKPKEIDSGPKKPIIQIGIALGGTQPKQLPAQVIDIKAEDKDE